MQIAYTIGGLVSGGVFHQPHMLISGTPSPEVDFPLAEHTVETITQAMWGVVNEDGTAAASRLPGIEFCGKTGTAQVISAEGKERAGTATQTKNNAWFVGFAPRRNPEIVVAVLVQGGGFGAVSAAPIAKDIVKAYYDKKNGGKQPELITQAPPKAPMPVAVMARQPQLVNSAPAEEQVPAATSR
jgi:penicillin-binding protein 2